MVQKIIYFLFLVTSVAACQSRTPNKMAVASPYTFVFDSALSSTDLAAKVDKEEVSLSQLYSPSPALQELEERMNKMALLKVYDKALATKESAKITCAFAKPKEDLKTLLKGKLSKNIEVEFDDSKKDFNVMLNDQKFSRESLAQDDVLFSRLMQSSFEQKVKALEGIITRRKILQVSQQANMTMEDYIQQKILKGTPLATDEEVMEFSKKNSVNQEDMTVEMKAQIKDTIMARRRDKLTADYIAKNFVKDPILLSFNQPTMRLDLPKIEDKIPHKGNGPIQIALFSYVRCEECKGVTRALSDLVDKNPKYYRLSYVFNFPENNNEERMVAEAAMCLSPQGDKYFWEFPQKYQQQENGSVEDSINMTVKNIGANYDEFRTCFLARNFKESVDAQIQSTKNLGFYKSPVVVIDGAVLEDATPQHLVDKAQDLKAEKGLGFNFFYHIRKFFNG